MAEEAQTMVGESAVKFGNNSTSDIPKYTMRSFWKKMAIASVAVGVLMTALKGGFSYPRDPIDGAFQSAGGALLIFFLPALLSYIPAFLLKATRIGYRRLRLWSFSILWGVLVLITIVGTITRSG